MLWSVVPHVVQQLGLCAVCTTCYPAVHTFAIVEMAAERSGMTSWVSAIRLSMANDPGRQILEDQIQGGFLFLEDYLENILVGPRHE